MPTRALQHALLAVLLLAVSGAQAAQDYFKKEGAKAEAHKSSRALKQSPAAKRAAHKAGQQGARGVIAPIDSQGARAKAAKDSAAHKFQSR